MSQERITEALPSLFASHRAVFCHDVDNEFGISVKNLLPDDIELRCLDSTGARIQLDLDDGVKVNYGKFGDLLAEVKVVTGGTGDE